MMQTVGQGSNSSSGNSDLSLRHKGAGDLLRLGSWVSAMGAMLVIALVLWCVPGAHAQTTAQLNGTVTDPSGGVIPDATVTLINQSTGDKRVVQTNSAGLYAFPSLLPSTYTLQAAAKGFSQKQITGIVLHAGDNITIPAMALTIGAATQTVTVSATSQLIPEDNGSRTEVLDSKQIENLALEGRDTTELLKVLPGATTLSGGLTQNSPTFSDLNVSANESSIGNGININGVPYRGGTQLLSDGVSVIDPGDMASSISIIDPSMTQEVSVQTADFGADTEYGPVVVSAISKSGGDHYHGEAYFDARNNVLNANGWQQNHQGVGRGDAHYYYPGGNIGGPVPGTHHKVFFWGGYERWLQNNGNSSVLESYIPSPEMMAGDFTTDNADNKALCPNGFSPTAKNWCNDLSNTVYPDGSSAAASDTLPGYSSPDGGKTYYDNGQDIPSQFLDPGMADLAKFWPKANANPATTPGGYNYYEPVANINNGWIYRLRVDYDLSTNTKMYVSYQQAYSAELAQGNGAHIYWTPGNAIPFPGGGVYGYVHTKALAGHFLHTFNSTTTNEFIASWGYGSFPFGVPNISAAYKSTLGYTNGAPLNTGSLLIPSYASAGTETFPDFSQNDIFENPPGVYEVKKEVPEFADNLTKVWGNHTVKMGASTQNTLNLQSNDGTYINGEMSAFGQATNLLTGRLTGSPNNPTANFLLGSITGYQQQSAAPISDMAYQNTGFYINDNWHVNNRLNLELGTRFDHVGHWYDRNGVGMAVFEPSRVLSDFNSGKADPGYYWHAIDPGIPLSGQPNRLAFVSPRFGMSWDLFGNGKTVIRGGWGAYRFAGQYNDYAAALTTAQGVTSYNLPSQKEILDSQLGSITPAKCGNPPVPYSSACTTGAENGLDPTDYGVPRTYDYNLTIDEQLPWNSQLDIAYVGNSTGEVLDDSETIEGSDFTELADQNKVPIGAFFQPDPVTGVTSSNPENLAYQTDGTPTGNTEADYRPYGYAYGTNAVVEAKSDSYSNYNGLQITYVKTQGRLTYNFNFTWSKSLGTSLQENPFDIHANYGPESIDRPYVFNASYTYQTGSIHNFNRMVNGALSGWTISGISTWQSGGSLLALLGNGVPTFGLSETYTNLPANATADQIGTGIGDPTYYGTSAPIGIQPVLTCNPNHGLHKYQRVNLACFSAPAVGTYGGQKYPYMSMGSYFDNDLALYKTFHIHGSQNVQFRASAFNWLNHPLPQFSSQNQINLYYNVDYPTKAISLNTGSGGTVSNWGYMDTKTSSPYERIIELNVKYNF